MAPSPPERSRRLLRRLELLGVGLVLLAGLVPRARDLRAGFDRGVEGWQGAFFALGAVNYERLGIARSGGYPVVNVDLGERGADAHGLWEDPRRWVVYTNHPPLVPLLAWAALKGFGPEGWNEAWKEGRGPRGIELALRAPFLALHAAALLAFWWMLRQGHGAQRALLGLALLAAAPAMVIYAPLVNYENPALPFVLLGCGFYARLARGAATRDGLLFVLCFALGAAVTWSPLAFLPPLALHAIVTRRTWAAPWVFCAGLLALALLAAHAFWAEAVLARLGQEASGPLTRARELLAPLLDGSRPIGEWAALQVERLARWSTLPVLAAALAGLAVAVARAWGARGRSRTQAAASVDLSLPLLAGGILHQFAFYRHTLEEQTSFLMYLAPGVCALAALALDALAPLLSRLRAGFAPLALLAASLALFSARRFNELRFELRAAGAGESSSGASLPELPLPETTAADVRALIPSGSLGLYPSACGLNLAVAFYAWRSLWGVSGPGDRSWERAAERMESAERWLLVPRSPPAGAVSACAALRESLAAGRPPDAESGAWQAWRLGI